MDLTVSQDEIQPILTATSLYEPFRLSPTEPLLLSDGNWHKASVSPEQGTWPRIDGKCIVIGDCKYTPQEIKVMPVLLTSDPGCLVLWLYCLHPPTFLPKGRIITQVIPLPDSPETTGVPTVNTARAIGEDKTKETCKLTVGGETTSIEGVMDTGTDITVIPEGMWPSHWALQSVPWHIQGIGGLELARQSKTVVQMEGSKGQLANLCPFILDYPEPLLGRDLLAQ